MRNAEWTQAMQAARYNVNFNNHLYFNDLWVPSTLKQGDIIRADLNTDYYKPGEYELCPRNCLVLGLYIHRQTMELEGIRVTRFSYDVNSSNEDFETVFDPADPFFRSKLPGLRRAAIFRARRTEILSPGSETFGFFLDRPGYVSPATFPDFALALGKGAEFRHQRNWSTIETAQDLVYVPGLDPDLWPQGDRFRLADARDEQAANGPARIEDLPETERDTLIARMKGARPVQVLSARLQRYADRKLFGHITNAERDAEAALKTLIRSLRRTAPDSHDSAHVGQLLDRALAPLPDELDPLAPRTTFLPDLRTLIERQFALRDIARQGATGQASLGDLHDLQRMGIGGEQQDLRVELPSHLWRGKYLTVKAPNLLRPDITGMAYRPCVLWKAYADRRTGELSGLELHPCTRTLAPHFNMKIRVTPFGPKRMIDTPQPDPRQDFKRVANPPSFLIASMILRLPLDTRYFHDRPATSLFYELHPGLVQKVSEKRALAETRDNLTVYGLQTIPEHWEEIPLPDAPDPRTQKKYIREGHAMAFMPV